MVMAAHVEFGRLYDSAASLTGSAQDNQLVANAAVASILDGAAGADTLWGSALGETMTGGAGDDVIYTYGGADRISYAATGWGFDQVVAFDRAGGAKFDMRGSGLTFQDLAFTSADGNTQFATPQDRTLVYGMASLEVSDFIF
jgi:Ca2+-binding RTX toxin-like protein